jgi:hypothetical protein
MAYSGIDIRLDVSGDAAVQARFLRTGDIVRERIRTVLQNKADELAARATAAAPRGKTGQLAASIDASKVADFPRGLEVRVRPWYYRDGQGRKFGNYALALVIEKGLAAKRIWNVRHASRFASAQEVQVTMSKNGTAMATLRRVRRRVTAQGWWRKRPSIPPRPFMGFAGQRDAIAANVVYRINVAIEAALAQEAA